MLASLFSSLALVAILFPNAVQAVPDYTVCLNYSIIVTRGPEEPECPHCAFSGMMGPALRGLPKNLEASQVDIVWSDAPDVSPNTIDGATQSLSDYLTDRFKVCPDEKYALVGYHEGAIPTIRVAAALANTPNSAKIKAIALMSNPLRIPNRSGNVDEKNTNTNAGSVGALSKLNAGGSEMSAALDMYANDGRILDICFTGDQHCDTQGKDMGPNASDRYAFSDVISNFGSRFLVSKLLGPTKSLVVAAKGPGQALTAPPKVVSTEPKTTDPTKAAPEDPKGVSKDPKPVPSDPKVAPADPKVAPADPKVAPTNPKVVPANPNVVPVAPKGHAKHKGHKKHRHGKHHGDGKHNGRAMRHRRIKHKHGKQSPQDTTVASSSDSA